MMPRENNCHLTSFFNVGKSSAILNLIELTIFRAYPSICCRWESQLCSNNVGRNSFSRMDWTDRRTERGTGTDKPVTK